MHSTAQHSIAQHVKRKKEVMEEKEEGRRKKGGDRDRDDHNSQLPSLSLHPLALSFLSSSLSSSPLCLLSHMHSTAWHSMVQRGKRKKKRKERGGEREEWRGRGRETTAPLSPPMSPLPTLHAAPAPVSGLEMCSRTWRSHESEGKVHVVT